MGPEKRKDEAPRSDEAPEHGAAEQREEVGEGASAPQQAIDPREEDGWSQPESSAQKGPEPEYP